MRLTLLVAFVCGPSGSLHCQTACAAEHYRWTEKTSVALATKAATRTTVRQMLAWDTLAVDGKKAYQCAKRRGLERNVYSVTGWVRRVGAQDDGDWHIELTQTRRGALDSCIVVEIPPGDDDPTFDEARASFERLLGSQVK